MHLSEQSNSANFRDADFRYDHVVEPIDARRDGYLDEIYLAIVKIFQDTFAAIVHFFDEFLISELLVGGLARSASGMGNFFRRLQNGNLQNYAILFGAGILLVIYLTVFAR